MHEPVVISGLGVVCALGCDRDSVEARARAGERPFAPMRRFDASRFRVSLAAEAPALDIVGRFGQRIRRWISRTDELALWAAADALSQADLQRDALANAGLFVGASSGGMAEMEGVRERGAEPTLHTYWCYPVASTVATLSRHLGIRGPRATYMTACSSSAHALGQALHALRRGEIELAVVGGAEAICRLTLAGFGSLGVLDGQGARPFCTDRAGITLGEGAAFFVLESRSRAERRGVPALGELAGYGAADDAYHMVHPRDDGAGALKAMRSALRDAGVQPSDIDYVNAHGTGTIQNDIMEAKALSSLFEGVAAVRVSSSKSMVGHTLGAAGAIETALVVLGMNTGFVPPNPGVLQPVAELQHIKLVRRVADEPPPRVVLSSSFAFGGNNAALVLRAPDVLSAVSNDGHVRAPPPALQRPAPKAGIDGVSVAAADENAVVITGGAVASPQGTGATPQALLELLRSGSYAARAVVGLDPARILGRANTRRMDRLSAAVTAVAALALSQSGLSKTEDLAVGFGTAFGALDQTLAFLDKLFTKGPKLVNPLDFPNLVHNAPAGYMAMRFGATGPNLTACQDELAGDEVVFAMSHHIARGDVPAALCCGGDLQSNALDAAYALVDRALRTASQHASVVGAVVLEQAAGCTARDGTPWARILGMGRAGPWSGVQGAVGHALEQASRAGARPSSVDLWYAGATERLGRAHEKRAATWPLLAKATRVGVRAQLGDAQGSGPAVLALGAAAVASGYARHLLVTSVTRDGSAQAFILGPAGSTTT